MEAAFTGLTMDSLRCAGHPSQAWAAMLAIPQVFAPGSVAVLHLTNLALGVLAVIAVRVVLARAFPHPRHARDLDLVAIACAVHPVLLSTLVQPNVDFGVYVGFFVALAGLLTPGTAGTVAALVGGMLAVFSKETGVPAYALALAVAAAIEWHTAGGTAAAFVARSWRRFAVLAVPLVLFALHVPLWNATHEEQAIWKHGWQERTADGFNFFDLSEPTFRSYAAGLFIIGFLWVAWLPVAVDGAVGLAAMVRRRHPRPIAGAHGPTLAGLTVLTVVLTYLLTSFRTWSNLRYFAPLYPLFLILTYAALTRLRVPAARRRLALGGVVTLFVVAAFRSVDPLSRAVYGTFDAGERRMYRMTSITQEFEGPGRDQLVYNLEFTGYHHVQNALYRALQPGDSTVIGAPRHVRWNIWSQLDATSRLRSMRRDGVMMPVYADEVDIAARRSAAAWFLDFSNHGEDDHALATLLPRYAVTDSIVVHARGQRLVARHLVRLVEREAAVLP
jgi:hypothetical protein